MRQIRALLASLFLLFIGLAVVLGLAELYFRQTVRLLPPMAQSDPITIYSLLPNLTVRDTSPGDFSVEYSTNSRGMRYREITLSKSADTFRVLGLGDSFAFGVGVQTEQSFLGLLEKNLASQTSQRVEVLNTGVTGYGTSHELAFLEGEGFALDPNLVLVSFYANDPDDSYTSGLYSISNGTLKRTPPNEVPKYLPERQVITQLPLYSFLANNSALFAELRQLYFLQRQSDLRTEVEKNIYSSTGSTTANAISRPDIELTRLLMAHMRDITQAKKIPLVFLLIPYRWSPDADLRTINAGMSPILDICNMEGLNCIDMIPVLYRSELRIDELYYARDIHWKPAAHKLAAYSINSYLVEHQMIPR